MFTCVMTSYKIAKNIALGETPTWNIFSKSIALPLVDLSYSTMQLLVNLSCNYKLFHYTMQMPLLKVQLIRNCRLVGNTGRTGSLGVADSQGRMSSVSVVDSADSVDSVGSVAGATSVAGDTGCW